MLHPILATLATPESKTRYTREYPPEILATRLATPESILAAPKYRVRNFKF